MQLKARLRNSGDEGRTIVLEKLPAVLGRGLDADVHLDDRFASHRHCEISQRDGVLYVRDLGSRHGSLVNGGYQAEAQLLPGDRLTVGLTTFVVQYGSKDDSHEGTPDFAGAGILG